MAVTNRLYFFIALLFWQCFYGAGAAVLPEDRADAMYHEYNGGGVKVSGPSILVRKQFGDSVSLLANHYVDSVSSASIDVVTQASPYTEERTEQSVGIDYLEGSTLMSLSMTNSSESDYDADTFGVSMTESMFGDLTTVTLAYSQGDNVVRKNKDDTFEDFAKLKDYRVSLSQVLSKNMLMSVAFEAITDEGYLNNPYRSVRYVDTTVPIGYKYQTEVYPRTRTSNALGVHLRYYLPYRAAIYGGYRYFEDSWGIAADTYDIGYVHPYGDNWTFEASYRFYSQSKADFYSDLFPYPNAQNFLARDKELSTFDSRTFGLGATYEFAKDGWGVFDKGSLNLFYSYMVFDYQDFRDLTSDGAVGEEPLYSFSANVYRAFVSLWF